MRCAREDVEVGLTVASRTTHGCRAAVVRAADDTKIMNAALVALPRTVANNVAVETSRVKHHLRNLLEVLRAAAGPNTFSGESKYCRDPRDKKRAHQDLSFAALSAACLMAARTRG